MKAKMAMPIDGDDVALWLDRVSENWALRFSSTGNPVDLLLIEPAAAIRD
jgi:hypothetical protein